MKKLIAAVLMITSFGASAGYWCEAGKAAHMAGVSVQELNQIWLAKVDNGEMTYAQRDEGVICWMNEENK